MSYPVSLKLQIQGDADVQNKIRSIKQELSGLGKGAGQSFQELSRSSEAAAKSTDQFSKSAVTVGKSATGAQKATTTLGTSVKNASGGFALAGASAVSLWNAYDNVTDASKKVEITENRVRQSELRLSKAREALNKLQESGTASALDLQQAQEQVRVAEGNVERAAFNLTNAQESLNEAWLNAATSVIPAVFTGISGIGQIMQAFQKTAVTTATTSTEMATSIAGIGVASATSATPLGVMTGATQTATTADVELTSAGTVAATTIAGVGTAAGAAVTPLGSFGISAGEAGVAVGGLTAANTLAEPSLAGVGTSAEAGAVGMNALSTSAKGAAISMAAVVAPAAAIVAAFAGIVVAGAAIHDNIGGAGDAFGGFVTALEDTVGASDETRQAIDDVGFSLGDMLDRFISVIPIVNDFWLSIGGKKPVDFEVHAQLADRFSDLRDKTNAAKIEQEAMTKATGEYNQALSKLSPMVAGAADNWQLYNNGIAATTKQGERMLTYLQGLDKNMDTAEQGVIALAQANGVDLWHALNMTDEQMRDFMLTTQNLKPTAEMAAEAQKKASQDIADNWIDSFDRIKAAQDEFGSSMRSAMGSMGQELGEEMEVGLSDLEKTVSKGMVGFSDQFFEEIFPEDFLANAIIEGNSANDIKRELKDLMHDVVDEDIVSKEDAKGMLQPMIDYFAEDLPDGTEKSIGYIAGQLPSMLEKWKPAILNGMIPVGAAGKEGIQKYVMDPILQGLGEIPTGKSGIDFGRGIIAMIDQELPNIEATAGKDVADMFRGILGNAELGVDEKVQSIIGLLGQVSPAFADQIMKMDSDADGIADIMDNKILGPVDTMRIGILSAFADIAQVAGDTTMYSKLIGKIGEIEAGTDSLNKELHPLQQGLGGVRQEVNGLNSELPTVGEVWDQWNQRIADSNTSLDTLQGAISSFDWSDFKAITDPADKATFGTSDEELMADVVAKDRAESALGPLRDALNEIYTQMTTAWNAFWDGLKTRDMTMPAPNTSLVTNAIGQFIGTVNSMLTPFWNSLANRNVVMPPPKTSIATQVIGQFIGTANSMINAFWDGIANRNVTMPPPNTSLVTQAIGDMIGTANSMLNSFWDGIKNRDTSGMEDPLTNLLQKNEAEIKGQAAQMGNDVGFEYVGGVQTGLASNRRPIEQEMDKIVQLFGIEKWEDVTDVVDSIFKHPNGKIYATINGMQQEISPRVAEFIQNLATTLASMDTAGVDNLFGQIVPASLTQWVPGVKTQYTQAMADLEAILQTRFGPIQGPESAGSGDLLAQRGIPSGGPGAGGGGAGAAGAATAMTPPLPDFTEHMARWTAYLQYVNTIVEGIMAGPIALLNGVLTQHAVWVGAQVDVAGQHLIRMATGYGLLAQAANTVFGQVIGSWVTHVSAVGGQVNAEGQQLIKLATGYGLLAQATGTAFGQIIGNWGTHVSAVGGQVNRAGAALIKLATGYKLLVQAGQRAMSALSTAVSSNISKIVAAMNRGAAAAKNLQSAINALKSKTITVTTRYVTTGKRTSGVQSAQHGFHGVVTQPTTFHTGEGYRPELVSVIPLSPNASGKVQMNRAAAAAAAAATTTATTTTAITNPPPRPTTAGTIGQMQAIVRSGASKVNTKSDPSKVADSIIINPSGTIMIFKASGDIEKAPWMAKGSMPDWIERSRAMLGKTKGLIGSEVFLPTAGGKLYKDIVERWAGSLGYSLRDYDTQKDGDVTIKIKGGKNSKKLKKDAAESFFAAYALKLKSGGFDKKKGDIYSIKLKPTKTDFRDEPTSQFSATGWSAMGVAGDPLRRGAALGGLTGRGGKSLMDLRFLSAGDVFDVARTHGKKPISWITEERRYADGSYMRIFSSGAVQFGRDIARLPNTGVDAEPKKKKKKDDGSVIKVYPDGTWAKFDKGGNRLKTGTHKFVPPDYKYNNDKIYHNGKEYTPKISAARGFSGMVSRPTEFRAGEGGNPEYVNIQPMNMRGRSISRGGAGAGGGGGGGGGGDITVRIPVVIDGRQITEIVKKRLMGGIYSIH